MNGARYFMRREDYQLPQTPADSPFRRFNMSCLKCGSFKLRVISEYDSESGEGSAGIPAISRRLSRATPPESCRANCRP